MMNATRIAARQMSTAAKFPTKGLAEGGHLNVLQKEAIREKFFNFKKTPENAVILTVVSFACALGTGKLLHDARAPDTVFTPGTRNDFEKRVLGREEDHGEGWRTSFFHKGLFSRPREILGIKASHPSLDYKN